MYPCAHLRIFGVTSESYLYVLGFPISCDIWATACNAIMSGIQERSQAFSVSQIEKAWLREATNMPTDTRASSHSRGRKMTSMKIAGSPG